jgi:autotransporter-associated beta strand protein
MTAVPGNLIIADAVVRNHNSYQVIGNITVGGGGLLDVNGYIENVDVLNLNDGGDVRTGTGVLMFKTGGALNVDPGRPGFLDPDAASISGTVEVLIGNLPINVGRSFAIGRSGPELSITAAIQSSSGIANLHKNGSGEMLLSGANTFTGVLYVNDGRVTAAHNSALGTTQGSTVVQTNGMLVLDGGITTGDFLILSTDAAVALRSLGGSNTVNAGINLLRPNCGIDVSSGGYLQVLGRVGSIGGLTKLGPGTLQFWGFTSNDYAGLTIVSNGVIEAGRVNRISIPGNAIIGHDSSATNTATIRSLREQQFRRSADITIHRSGLLDLYPFPGVPVPQPTLNRVLGAGRINLGAGTSLTISNSPSFEFAGVISGAGALNKYRAGTSMHLTGDSPFSGPTTIFEGFYRMDGSAPNSPVTVKTDGSLRGDGRVGAVTVEAGGTVNPSSSLPGRRGGDLRMSSANFLAGAILGLAFHGPHPTGGNDSLRVDGAVNLDGTRLSSGFQYAPREGDVLTLINKTAAGPVSGVFGGYPAGTQRFLGEIPVVASYTGGDGNDVTLTVTNVALRAAGFRIESGNGNGIIDRDECNLIWLGLQSRRNTQLTITHAELRTASSDTSVTIAQADYPTVPPLGTVTNLTPFQLRSTDLMQCIGESVALELRVTVPGEGTFAVPFLLPGGTDCNPNAGGGCESCIVVAGQFTTNTPTSNERLYFIGAPSDCLPDKPCPGRDPTPDLPPARYLTHHFTNSTTNDLCITVQLHFDCTSAPVNALGVAAYLSPFDPGTLCANYLGDIGFVGPSPYPPFSFRVPAGSNFVIVVTARAEPAGCDESYALEIFGLSCPPPRLHIAGDAAPGNVRLHWSTAYPDWRLQSMNSLNSSPPLPFQNLSYTRPIVGSHYNVTNPATGTQRVYRLAK